MPEEKCSYVKWFQFTWIIGIIVTILIAILGFLGRSVVANEEKSIQRDGELKDCIHRYIIPMKEDISAITSKLGITPRRD